MVCVFTGCVMSETKPTKRQIRNLFRFQVLENRQELDVFETRHSGIIML